MKHGLLACAFTLAAGCGGSKDPRSTWLEATLVPTTADHKGVKLQIDVPQGLPRNEESIVGPSWMLDLRQGPRLGLSVRERTWKTADELARDVEPDTPHHDLVEVRKQALPDGRLEYVSATSGNRHLDVAVWIPIDETRGVQASCHWYAGLDAKNTASPDAALLAWLTKICGSVRVAN